MVGDFYISLFWVLFFMAHSFINTVLIKSLFLKKNIPVIINQKTKYELKFLTHSTVCFPFKEGLPSLVWVFRKYVAGAFH